MTTIILRLLLRTPGPFPFGTCTCFTCWDQSFSLSLFFWTMLFEHPSVLSRFCSTLLYARLVGTYYGMARASVRPSFWASVCLSVRGSVRKACKHDRNWTVPARTVKLGTHTTFDKRTNPFDFQDQGSDVKITRWTFLLNLVDTIKTEQFQLGPSNLVHILLLTRGRKLLIIKVRGQRSRLHAGHCCKHC